VRMAVQWVFLEVFKTTVFTSGFLAREGIRTSETVSEAGHVATRTATHAAGESAKTGSTLFGSVARKIIWLGETIFHGVMTGIKVAAHLAGEALMTAASIANAAIRIPLILLEAGKWLVAAAFKAASAVADIPYVGPILAIAAIAGVIAAGVAAAGGFKRGGYTGDGPADQAAGTVHKGEYVFSAAQTAAIGKGNLAAIAKGGGSMWSRLGAMVSAGILSARDAQANAAAGLARPITSDRDAAAAIAQGIGGGSAPVVNVKAEPQVNVIYAYDRQAILDAMASKAGQAIVVQHVDNNRLKLGIKT